MKAMTVGILLVTSLLLVAPAASAASFYLHPLRSAECDTSEIVIECWVSNNPVCLDGGYECAVCVSLERGCYRG